MKDEEIWEKYMENKDSPCIRAMGLEKIPSSSPYLWSQARGVAISRLGVPQRKEVKHFNNNLSLPFQDEQNYFLSLKLLCIWSMKNQEIRIKFIN